MLNQIITVPVGGYICNTDQAWTLNPLLLGGKAGMHVIPAVSRPTLLKFKLGIVLHHGILVARKPQRVNAGLWC